jgi:putative hydrolase of the HAD superfamily
MTAYLASTLALTEAEANALRTSYWRRYGATLLGMMRHHGTDPHHFLWHTHQLPDMRRMVVWEHGLRSALKRLPGRKVVLSNSPRSYAEAVLALIGIRQALSWVCGIEQARFHPKPGKQGFLHVASKKGLIPGRCILVDDAAENLRTAKSLGMKTVWVTTANRKPAYVDLIVRSVLDLPRKVGRLP